MRKYSMRKYSITPHNATSFSHLYPSGINQISFSKLCQHLFQKTLAIFSPKRRMGESTLGKLKKIILDVLRYICRRAVDGVIALPKEVFTRAHAHGGSMRTLLNYQTVRSAFEKLGVIKSLGVKTYKGGPCQHYSVSLGEGMKIKKADEFINRDEPKSSVCIYDKYSIDILGDEVGVDGGQVTDFVVAYEKKLREFHKNPFIKVLKGGKLFKGANLSFYIRGAAICTKYNYSLDRFIEAQFFFFEQWKGEAPDIRYVTSVYTLWNSIGRYEQYCQRFKDSLDYFGKGKDNIEETTKAVRRKERPAFGIIDAIQMAKQDYYRIKDAFNFSDKDLFLFYGHPLRPMLSLHFLMNEPVWLTLLKEKAWGENIDTKFWIFLEQVDIQTLR